MEDVARREASLCFVDMHMFFGQGFVSSRMEDVARRERLVWVL